MEWSYGRRCLMKTDKEIQAESFLEIKLKKFLKISELLKAVGDRAMKGAAGYGY